MTYNFREGFKQIKRDDLVRDFDAFKNTFDAAMKDVAKEIAQEALVILEKEKKC